jgi:hypothetical protein
MRKMFNELTERDIANRIPASRNNAKKSSMGPLTGSWEEDLIVVARTNVAP